MQSFDDLNENTVYTKVKSRNAAASIKADAQKTTNSGKNVVIFFDNRYHLHLAPGQDPYKVRQEIDDWINNKTVKAPSKNTSGTSSSKSTESTSSKKNTSSRPSLK